MPITLKLEQLLPSLNISLFFVSIQTKEINYQGLPFFCFTLGFRNFNELPLFSLQIKELTIILKLSFPLGLGFHSRQTKSRVNEVSKSLRFSGRA